MRLSRLGLSLSIFFVLIAALVACQTPPAPAEQPAGAGVVRDLNVPGKLTAGVASIRDSLTVNGGATFGTLAVQNGVVLPAGSLTTAALDSFYFPLSLSGSVASSQALTDTVAAALIPADLTVGSIGYFARAVTGTVGCNVIYTTTELTPTQESIADAVSLTAGTVVTDIVQNGVLGAGYLVELGCATGGGETASDVIVTLWLK